MRSAILISLVVLLAVLAGGYSISWYAQSNATKHAIEQLITRINEKQKYITYDSIETSGFPSTMVVSIIRPHFNGRVDLLLKGLNDAAKAKNPEAQVPPPFGDMPEWQEDAKLEGRLIFSINALSDHYGMIINGNWQETSKINGKTYNTVHQQTGDLNCYLQLERNGGLLSTLWNFNSLVRDGQAWLHDFRYIDCNTPGKSFVDADSKAVLGSNGPVRFYVTSTPAGGQEQLRIYLKADDMLITPQGDALIAAYFQAMSPQYVTTAFSLYGKQNVNIDFSYYGPADWQKENKNPVLNIANKVDITNQVYNHHMTFLLSNNTTETNTRASKLTFKSQSDFSDQFDLIAQAALHNFIHQSYYSRDPRTKELQTMLQKYPEDQLFAIIYPSMPNFHSLGNVVATIDTGFNGAPDFSEGQFDITDIELSATPYGIKGNGGVKLEAKHPPAGNGIVTCANCLQMVDDIAGYATRIQKMVSYFDMEKAMTAVIDTKQVEGIKGFLYTLAVKNPMDKNTLNYSIASDPRSGVSINNKTITQVSALYREYIVPTLKQPDAAVPQGPAHPSTN